MTPRILLLAALVVAAGCARGPTEPAVPSTAPRGDHPIPPIPGPPANPDP